MADRSDRVRVVLSPAECALAESVGRLRRIAARAKGFVDGVQGEAEQALQADILGAMGECSVAKYVNAYWTGTIGEIDTDDVRRLQVRTTRHDDGRLIVRADDRNDRAFLLVVGEAPTFDLVGWIWGEAAKRAEWWTATIGRPPAYFVPQKNLAPLVMLPPSEYA